MTNSLANQQISSTIKIDGKAVEATFVQGKDGKYRLQLDRRYRIICDPLSMSDVLGWNGTLFDGVTKERYAITYWHGGTYGHCETAHKSMEHLVQSALTKARSINTKERA